MPYDIHSVNMHAQYFQEPKGDIVWTKHQINQKCTQRCDARKGCPKYIKESNNHKIDSKVQQMNEAKTNDHKE